MLTHDELAQALSWLPMSYREAIAYAAATIADQEPDSLGPETREALLEIVAALCDLEKTR